MRLGVDLGGTKTEIVALDSAGKERFRQRVATPRGDYSGTLEAITRLVGAAESVVGHSTVGVGTPGSISPTTGVIRNANSTWLNGRALARDLAERLQRPVRLANDANCFALSEAVDGAGAGRRVVFGVILGTGTGGGIVVDRQVVVGANAIAGEWGHNPLPWPEEGEWPGPACYCGRTGCVETFLSGPGLSDDHARVTGVRMDAKAIAAAAASGDRAAVATIDRYNGRLARGLASVVNLIDPDAIVLGGGLSNVGSLYSAVPQLWSRYVFSDAVATRLVRAAHGDSGGARGAAWLWNE